MHAGQEYVFLCKNRFTKMKNMTVPKRKKKIEGNENLKKGWDCLYDNVAEIVKSVKEVFPGKHQQSINFWDWINKTKHFKIK